MLGQDSAGAGACVGRVRALRASGSTGNCEQLLRSILLVRVHGHRIGATLDALRGKLRPLEEAVLALGVRAAEKWHRGRIDVGGVPVQDTSKVKQRAWSEHGSRLAPDARRERGSPKGALMNEQDNQDKEVFDQVDEVRAREGGLSDQLRRYRHSREEYEKLLGGSRDSTPSTPLERVRRQRSAGRLREAIERDD